MPPPRPNNFHEIATIFVIFGIWCIPACSVLFVSFFSHSSNSFVIALVSYSNGNVATIFFQLLLKDWLVKVAEKKMKRKLSIHIRNTNVRCCCTPQFKEVTAVAAVRQWTKVRQTIIYTNETETETEQLFVFYWALHPLAHTHTHMACGDVVFVFLFLFLVLIRLDAQSEHSSNISVQKLKASICIEMIIGRGRWTSTVQMCPVCTLYMFIRVFYRME